MRANWHLIAVTVGVHSYFISGWESFFISAPLASLQLNTKTWILFLEKDQTLKYEATGYKTPNPCWGASPTLKERTWRNDKILREITITQDKNPWRENIWFQSNKHFLPTDLGLVAYNPWALNTFIMNSFNQLENNQQESLSSSRQPNTCIT